MLSFWSQMFYNTFQLPEGQGNVNEGRSDENPVTLPAITAQDFTFLLQILFGHPLASPTLKPCL
jgi:hypothetical protein